MLGGGMRQAGILAAAGLIALQEHVPLLAEDHAKARRLAEGLAPIDELHIDPGEVQTNMVFARPGAELAENLKRYLNEQGIKVGGYGNLRMVTHLDVSAGDVERTIAAFTRFFAR